MPNLTKTLASAEDVEHAFYDAIARAELEGLMALWAEDDEIAYIHPGAPRLQGHAAIRESWELIFARGPVHIRPRHLHATHNMMCAVLSVVEDVKRPDDPDWQEAHILANNVYLKTPQDWRIVLHRSSIALGRLAEEALAAAGILH